MRTAQKVGLIVAYLLVIIFILTPFLYVLWASVQSDKEILTKPFSLIPRRFTLGNFLYLFTGQLPDYYQEIVAVRGYLSGDIRLVLPALANSFIVAAAVAVVNVILASPAAYAFTRFQFRGKQTLYTSVLISRLLPPMVIAIPYYIILKQMNLINTLQGIGLAHVTMTVPFVMWYLVMFFRSIPRDTEEAAMIDGCNAFQALAYVLMPIARPGLIAAAVFAFMFSYSDFLFPLFISQNWQTRTLPVAVAIFSQNPDTSYALVASTIVVGLAVPVTFALIMQRYITQALSTVYK